MTNLSPSTTSPEPGSPQPAGAFNWRSEKTADRPNDKRPIRPDRRPTTARRTRKTGPCVHFLKRACAPYDAICTILLYRISATLWKVLNIGIRATIRLCYYYISFFAPQVLQQSKGYPLHSTHPVNILLRACAVLPPALMVLFTNIFNKQIFGEVLIAMFNWYQPWAIRPFFKRMIILFE